MNITIGGMYLPLPHHPEVIKPNITLALYMTILQKIKILMSSISQNLIKDRII